MIYLVSPLLNIIGDLNIRDFNIIQYLFIMIREDILNERIREVMM